MSHNDFVHIALSSYDYQTLDRAVKDIISKLATSGVLTAVAIPLPTRIEKFTVLRSPHVNKKSREQFERRVHKRLIKADGNIGLALSKIVLPAGVNANIKYMNA